MRLRPTNLFLTIIIWEVAWNISADAAFDRLSYATQVWCGIGFSSSPSEPTTHRFFSTFSKPFTVSTLTEHFISYRFRLGTPFKVEIETDWQQFGTQTYAEDLQTLAVTISKAQFDLQAWVDRFQLRIDNFGQRSAFGLAVGAKWRIRPSFTTTLLVSRLNKPQLPSILSPTFSGSLQIQVQSNAELVLGLLDRRLTVAVDFHPHPNLSLHAGGFSFPSQLVYGFGFGNNRLNIGYRQHSHSQLHGTHQFSLAVGF
ncbi:MAG: hypothetical protein QGG39_00875 [Candidatus Poribacteria bacterium]|nr:hypothetical protein [Candidatus Poribacteria bacterium]